MIFLIKLADIVISRKKRAFEALKKYNVDGWLIISSGNDANAEYMSELRMLCDKHQVKWQTGELGKVDIGGGGTIAMFMSRYGMDTVDVGPCVLGMHSPCELASKSDIFSAYLFYKAFFEK